MADIAVSIAVTGVLLTQTRKAVATNNVSNALSIAQQAQRVESSSSFFNNVRRAGIIENAENVERPIGIQIGTGTKIVGTYRDLSQGPPKETKAPLDLLIKGSGYFAIALPGGKVGYTRAGSFKRSGLTGSIVTSDGKPFETDINIDPTIPTDEINISADGVISRNDPTNNQEPVIIGQLLLYRFTNEQGLQEEGNNLFTATSASGDAIDVEDLSDKFQQGWLELSNINTVAEMVEIVDAQQVQSALFRVIKLTDDEANNISKI